METRSCGRTSLRVPVLGVGCWSFGGGSYWGDQDQRDVDEVVAVALELGCGFFDTAEAYNEGRSEEALGRALRGRRDRAIVASKIAPSHCTPELLIRHCEASLRRLGTDYLDLYLIHWPLASPALGETLASLDKLARAGKIRHLGLSNFGVKQIAEARASGVLLACNELPYSLLSRAIEWEVMPASEREGMGVLGYMPLMQGLLTGKYRSAEELPPNRARTRHFRADRPGANHGEPGAEPETFGALEAIRGISLRVGIAMEHLAIAWSVARPAVSSTIVGARSAAQLRDNARAVTTGLAPEIVAELDRATDALKTALGRSVDLFAASDRSRTF